jgi:hypothetical protein
VREHAVAEAQEVLPVLARVGVLDLGQFRRAYAQPRLGGEARVQVPLGRTGILRRAQLFALKVAREPRIGGDQRAVCVAFEKAKAATRPEVLRHRAPVVPGKSDDDSISL